VVTLENCLKEESNPRRSHDECALIQKTTTKHIDKRLIIKPRRILNVWMNKFFIALSLKKVIKIDNFIKKSTFFYALCNPIDMYEYWSN